ncbi:MAG: hypothetical protein VX500_02600, partial [Planctomycetota bacterium]|nr:hypothetical protein [Planctomycetota bacterium]
FYRLSLANWPMVTRAMSHECSRSVRVRSAGLTESYFDGPSKPAMVGDIGVSGPGNPIVVD